MAWLPAVAQNIPRRLNAGVAMMTRTSGTLAGVQPLKSLDELAPD
jgi:hypothetical protein